MINNSPSILFFKKKGGGYLHNHCFDVARNRRLGLPKSTVGSEATKLDPDLSLRYQCVGQIVRNGSVKLLFFFFLRIHFND